MKYSLTIVLAISLVLGAAVAWGSCAVPRSERSLTISDPVLRTSAAAGIRDPERARAHRSDVS